MQINYWNEIELVSQASLITLISIGISLCCAASLFNLSDFYRNEKPLKKIRTVLALIFILSILTIILILVNNSLATRNPYRNAKIETILTRYWNDREYNPDFWNTLQSTYKCCGVYGNADWESAVPISCYQTQYTWLIWKKTITCPHAHESGCYCVIVKYFDEMTSWFEFIGLSFVSLAVFAIAGMLLTLFLNFLIHQNKNQSKSLAQV